MAASKAVSRRLLLSYKLTFSTIERSLHWLALPDSDRIVYFSEDGIAMDESRSIFPAAHAPLRLDAGTDATMGISLGYAIAAQCGL